MRSRVAIPDRGALNQETALNRHSLTLVELLLVYAVLALALLLLAGVGGYVQKEAKKQLAADRVLVLREALLAYHQHEGLFPEASSSQGIDHIIAEVNSNRFASQVMLRWPGVYGAGRHYPRFKDPWGRSFRYIDLRTANVDYGERVQMDGGLPIFESAGPDGRFGETHSNHAEDNIASDTAMMLDDFD